MTGPNVLFIAVDDLRTALGCYGDPNAITPNIDRLARRGMRFERAYCQQAVCNPSRASLMTGMRPDTLRVWDLKSHFRQELPPERADLPQYGTGTHFRAAQPDVITLPQWFRQHGYQARAAGKIYHGSPEMQDPASWSAPAVLNVIMKRDDGYVLPENHGPEGLNWPGPKMAATECADVPDNAYGDGKVADAALEILDEIQDQPFFLAVGFRKPHLPFSAPKRYWDLYDRDQITPPDHPTRPSGIPDYAWHHSVELRGYNDIPKEGPLPDELVRKLRHGYYACVSYMDAQVGKLLDALDARGLTENTVIVLWGDHGYHLGEKALWCKTTNYELDTRAPLILSVPGQAHVGEQTSALVEFVDVYPTLAEACGLPLPEHLEGLSLLPLLDDPDQPWKKAAFSQFPRPWTYKGEPEVMGYTIRTADYRYTAWLDFHTRATRAQELYDHRQDAAEVHNVADDPAYRAQVEAHAQLLQTGWRAALPERVQRKG
ncbi:MAG: sulfatase [Anaerolineae bacterium]|nr:sulfatase [Anaerolineae bacterium]